jgi:hypothetical protein
MNVPDPRILKLIKKHHIFTLASSQDNNPYCATCFYVFDENNMSFIFTSEKHTKHISDIENNNRVAGAIAYETRLIGVLRGVQFTGNVRELEGIERSSAKKAYIRRFPVAAPFLKDTPFWVLEADFFKMTDNRLGFGKKLIWYRNS